MIVTSLAMIAALGFACTAIIARIGLQYSGPQLGTAISITASFILTASLALLFEMDSLLAIPPEAFLWFVFHGLINYPVARFLNYSSINMIGSSRSQAIISAAPIFSAFEAILLLGERPTWMIVLGTVLIIVAIILLTYESGNSFVKVSKLNRKLFIGILIALGAAAGYGSTSVIGKVIVDTQTTPLVAAMFAQLFGGSAMWAIALSDMRKHSKPKPYLPLRSIVALVLAGAVSAIAVSSLLFALNRSTIVYVVPIVSINPLFTLIINRLFFQKLERITWALTLSTTMVVVGIILVVLG